MSIYSSAANEAEDIGMYYVLPIDIIVTLSINSSRDTYNLLFYDLTNS